MEDSRRFLGRQVTVTVDRPLGTKHPKWGFVYPVNYGFIEGVEAPDGEWLDAYLLGVLVPVGTFTGVCIAVIHRLDDDDDKLIVVPGGSSLSDEEIRALTGFQERFFKSVIWRE